MINVTKLYCGSENGAPVSAQTRRPVVVWTMTRRCNLRCLHCATDSENLCYPGELNRGEAVQMLDDLATFKIPALLLSGGEPLMHPNFFSAIWQDESHPMLKALRNRPPLLKGRCAACQWKPFCGGSFRVRAQFAHGDPWASDPACYLTDEEIGCR